MWDLVVNGQENGSYKIIWAYLPRNYVGYVSYYSCLFCAGDFAGVAKTAFIWFLIEALELSYAPCASAGLPTLNPKTSMQEDFNC